MEKLIKWLKESHRWLHLAGGALVGIFANDVYCAAYAGVGVAGATELKDKLYGNKFDWIDFGLTVLGTAIGFGVRTLFINCVL